MSPAERPPRSSLGGRIFWEGAWASETATRLGEGMLAVLLFFVAQLMIAGLTILMDNVGFDFPAPIIAMIAVFAAVLSLRHLCPSLDGFYQRWLKAPTDLLNRHMSIGFVVPLMMINKGPFASPKQVGLILCCFLITGIFNSLFAYYLSFGCQTSIGRWRWHRRDAADIERPCRDNGPPVSTGGESAVPSPPPYACRRSRGRVSGTSTLVSAQGVLVAHDEQDLAEEKTRTHRQLSAGTALLAKGLDVLKHNLLLAICLLSLPLVGLPTALATGNDVVVDTALLFALWTATLAAQAGVKASSSGALARRPRGRALLAASLNAVLWTALAATAYLWAKTAARHTTITRTLDAFVTNATFADLITHSPAQPLPAGPPPPPPTLGAGDVALAVLDAGIVSWGLKLYECRGQLLSRAGLTVLAATAATAAANVVCGPLLAAAVGVRPAARDLAFAARSVTLALAGPAMASLGGDAGLNAVMVVVNGVIFQVGMGMRLTGLNGEAASTARNAGEKRPAVAEGGVLETTRVEDTGRDGDDRGYSSPSADDGGHDSRTVAAGVAVGVNAAAMGTAYLYEQGSPAAQFSTLAMTLFGVMTVVLTSVRPLVVWLVAEVSP